MTTEIRYTHRLNGRGECSCQQFAWPVRDPYFGTMAAAHFIESTGRAVIQQTGWRGLLYRWRNRP